MRSLLSLAKFFLVVFIVVGMCAPAFGYEKPKPIPGQYIVMFKQDKIKPVKDAKITAKTREEKVKKNQAKRQEVLNKINSHIKKSKIKKEKILHKYADAASGYAAKLSPSEVKMLKQDPDVAGVLEDFEVSLGPIQPDSTTAPAGITAQGGYVTCAVNTAGGPVNGSGKATWIWILDTGINQTHPDLNVQTNTYFAKSFISGQSVEDGHGHGTHCAGIAAAKNNTIGPTGVSAGAKVVPVKVLSNTGSGSWSGLMAGLNHVAGRDMPGDVVSMSIGGYPVSCNVSSVFSTAFWLNYYISKLTNYGTYVVMAAGNDSNCSGASQNLPGCINRPRAYTVGALNCNKTRASYSNFHPSVVDYVAVGTGVYSTYKNRGYATMSGTSMATPVVAGVIHARGGPPAAGGYANCCGKNYPIAHR